MPPKKKTAKPRARTRKPQTVAATPKIHEEVKVLGDGFNAELRIAGPNNLATLQWDLSPRFTQPLDEITWPYASHPPTFTSIEILSSNLKAIPFRIYQGTRDENREDDALLKSGPWVDLFDSPTPFLTGKQWWHVLVTWWDQAGDVVIVKRGKNGGPIGENDIPAQLHPFNGRDFTLRLSEDKSRFLGWASKTRIFGKTDFDFHEVVKIHRPDARNPITGVGVQDATGTSTRADVKAQRFDEAFLDNGCVVSGVLTADSLAPNQVEEIKRQIQDTNAGYLKAFRLLALHGSNVKFTPNMSTHHDMQFREKREWTRDETFMARRIPKSEVGLEPPANMITGQGAQARNLTLWTGAILPMMADFEDALYARLFKPIDPTVFGEFDRSQIEALKPNMEVLFASAQQMLGLGYTVNEINEHLQLGLPDIEGGAGDVRYVAAGFTPVDDGSELLIGMEDEEEKPGGSDEAGDDGSGDEEDDEASEIEEENAETVTRLGLDMTMPEVRGHVDLYLLQRDAKRESIRRRIEKRIMRPSEGRFRTMLRRYFKALFTDQIKRIRKLDVQRVAELIKESPVVDDCDSLLEYVVMDSENPLFNELRDSVEEVLFPREEWAKRLKGAAQPQYLRIIKDTSEDIFSEMGGNFAFDITDPRMVDLVAKRQEILVRANDTIRRQMARLIETSIRNGASIREIQEAIRGTFGFSSARALTIARTEVAATANESRFEVMQAEGVTTHIWVTARDEAVRASHVAQDGAAVSMGGAFPNGLRFPGDPTGPIRETANCRCVTVTELSRASGAPVKREEPPAPKPEPTQIINNLPQQPEIKLPNIEVINKANGRTRTVKRLKYGEDGRISEVTEESEPVDE